MGFYMYTFLILSKTSHLLISTHFFGLGSGRPNPNAMPLDLSNAKEPLFHFDQKIYHLIEQVSHRLWKDYIREERGALSTMRYRAAKPRFQVQTPSPHQSFHKLQNESI